ncbi:hypothetical protein HPP92_009448 [Vanilla planifolia]|uniref:Uncharacterized protein n=1 Tax=Vanilla planifolia TaxID=51239 RepID=A0A835RAL8_VANPL|nr:hypothetical protein HPP92_009448 [Vanilla planifolia]
MEGAILPFVVFSTSFIGCTILPGAQVEGLNDALYHNNLVEQNTYAPGVCGAFVKIESHVKRLDEDLNQFAEDLKQEGKYHQMNQQFFHLLPIVGRRRNEEGGYITPLSKRVREREWDRDRNMDLELMPPPGSHKNLSRFLCDQPSQVSFGDMIACDNENCEGGNGFTIHVLGLPRDQIQREVVLSNMQAAAVDSSYFWIGGSEGNLLFTWNWVSGKGVQLINRLFLDDFFRSRAKEICFSVVSENRAEEGWGRSWWPKKVHVKTKTKRSQENVKFAGNGRQGKERSCLLRCGRIDEQIGLLKHKLKSIDEGSAFGGRMSKIARSQGKKFHVTIQQEKSRLLGNLAWAYMQYENYKEAEPLYRRALEIQKDYNKMCNLSICLMQTGTVAEAKKVLQDVKHPSNNCNGESYQKSYERAWEMMDKLDLEQSQATASLAIPQSHNCFSSKKPFFSPVSEKGNSGFNISVYSAKGDKTDHNTENIVIRVDIQMLRPRKKRPKDGRTVHKSRLERDEISMENLDSFAPAKGNPQPNGDSCSIKLEENEDFTCKQNLFCSSNEGSPKATSALKTGEGNSGDQKIQSQEKCWIRQTATEGTPHSQHMSWYNVKSVHQKKFRSSDRKETTVLWGGKRAIVEGFEDSDHWFGMGRRQSCGEQRKRLQVFNEIASDDATSW